MLERLVLRPMNSLGSIEASQDGANGDIAIPDTQTFFMAPIPPSGEVGVSINDGCSYSVVKAVSIYMVWRAGVSKAQISNDGAFSPSRIQVFDLDSSLPWELDDSITGLDTKMVYVRFSGFGIDTTRTYSDDVICDNTAPTISSATGSETSSSVTLILDASDDIFGVSTIEISTGPRTITWDYSSTTELDLGVATAAVRKTSSREALARVKDSIGNWSKWQEVSLMPKSAVTPSVSSITSVTPLVPLAKPSTGAVKSKTISSLAKSVNLFISKGVKLKFRVPVKSAKTCKALGRSVKGLKAGSCEATLTVKPVKYTTVTKTATIKISTSFSYARSYELG